MEREEDELSCFGAEDMPVGGAEALWRGRRGGEGSAMESTVAEARVVERGHGELSRCCCEVSFPFFRIVGASKRVDEHIRCGCWACVTAHYWHRLGGQTPYTQHYQ
jgi:hypothetical protein